MARSIRNSGNLGQVIEYIPGTSQSRPWSLCLVAAAIAIAMSLTVSLCYGCLHATPQPSLHTALTILDRLYLASYVEAPDESTLFPYPDPPRSPSKRSQRAVDGPSPALVPNQKQPFYFTVDDTLLYNAFHHDFGPLHIGHLYRFALQFHEILGAKENKDRPIVFWSRADSRSMWPPPF